MIHICNSHHHKKRWKPKAVKANQMATKTKNKAIAPQLSVGTTDSPDVKNESSAFIPDRPTLEVEPSAPCQNASNDALTPM
jgi:hypothetical protein